MYSRYPYFSQPQFPLESARWIRLGCGVVLGVSLAACNPTYNWRELRPDGTPLQALMPCKPEVAQRPVPLSGETTELHMYSCETGGLTFAVAWVDVGEPARAVQAMVLLRKAALAAIRVDPAQADAPALQWPAQVHGAQAVLGLQAQGVQHAQRGVRMKAVHFASGRQVYQAAVYGSDVPAEISDTFFDGLRLP